MLILDWIAYCKRWELSNPVFWQFNVNILSLKVSRKCKIIQYYFALIAGSNRIKYLRQRVKMSEMWSSRRAANKTSGPGLGVEGRDGPRGVRSHNLTNRTLCFNQLPSGPFLKFSVKSVTIQQTREKLRIFFQEMNRWSTYFFSPSEYKLLFLPLLCFIDHWFMTMQRLKTGLTLSPIHILRHWSSYWGRYQRLYMKIITSLLIPWGDSLISTVLRKTFNTLV